MTEISSPESKIEKPPVGGCLGELVWFFSGAVLPLGSFTFYRRAAQRSVANAMAFFLLFTLAIASLSTIGIGVSMASVTGDIRQAYADGTMPEIVIRGGVAEVQGPQPIILVDELTSASQALFIAIDTTGELTEIDSRRYDQGLLLTRTDVHLLDRQGQYQVLPLAQMHSVFSADPIVLDVQTVSQAWGVFTVILVLVMFVLLVVWHTVVRLMYLALAALVVWGIVSLLKPNTGFGPVIISGLYALVPAIYLSHLFSRSGLGLPGLQTLFLMIFWAAGLVAILADLKALPDGQPLRPWTAAIGAPLVITFIVDMLWQFPSPYGPLVLWVLTFLTAAVLIGLRLFLRFGKPVAGQPAS
jgi:hypothetical protein